MFRHCKSLSRLVLLILPAVLVLTSAGRVRADNDSPAAYEPQSSGYRLTQWAGSENLCGYGALTFQLYTKGRVVMFDAQATTDGVWQQNGQQITMWFAGGRVVYTGVINGSVMSGTAQSGYNSWSWSVAPVAFSTPVEAPTQWVGGENLCGYGNLTFQLYTGGRAVMVDSRSITQGTWQQNGQQVTLSFDRGRIVYTGVLSGNAMSGSARNGASSWNWSLSR